jgi:chemotaxis protein CheD
MNFPAGANAGRVIPVRMGEMAVSKTHDDALSIVGLGSCVALVLLARSHGAAAMAHIVLPDSQMAGGRDVPPAKFADTAVPEMIRQLRLLRVELDDLNAVVVGGATMFGTRPGSKLAGVGDRNIEAVMEELDRHGIPVIGMDVGGENGRSIQVAVGIGRVLTKSGLEEPLEVGGTPVKAGTRVPRRTNVRPAPEPFPDDVWAGSAEGSLTA